MPRPFSSRPMGEFGSRTVRLDKQVYQLLKDQADPLSDAPNDTLRIVGEYSGADLRDSLRRKGNPIIFVGSPTHTQESQMSTQLCEGAQDEHGAVCEGPNVKRYHATGTFHLEGDSEMAVEKEEFDAWWCEDCVDIARGMGYKVEVV